MTRNQHIDGSNRFNRSGSYNGLYHDQLGLSAQHFPNNRAWPTAKTDRESFDSPQIDLQCGIDTIVPHACKVADSFDKTFGSAGSDATQFAEWSKRNAEVFAQCGITVMLAFQVITYSLLTVSQMQWNRTDILRNDSEGSLED